MEPKTRRILSIGEIMTNKPLTLLTWSTKNWDHLACYFCESSSTAYMVMVIWSMVLLEMGLLNLTLMK